MGNQKNKNKASKKILRNRHKTLANKGRDSKRLSRLTQDYINIKKEIQNPTSPNVFSHEVFIEYSIEKEEINLKQEFAQGYGEASVDNKDMFTKEPKGEMNPEWEPCPQGDFEGLNYPRKMLDYPAGNQQNDGIEDMELYSAIQSICNPNYQENGIEVIEEENEPDVFFFNERNGKSNSDCIAVMAPKKRITQPRSRRKIQLENIKSCSRQSKAQVTNSNFNVPKLIQLTKPDNKNKNKKTKKTKVVDDKIEENNGLSNVIITEVIGGYSGEIKESKNGTNNDNDVRNSCVEKDLTVIKKEENYYEELIEDIKLEFIDETEANEDSYEKILSSVFGKAPMARISKIFVDKTKEIIEDNKDTKEIIEDNNETIENIEANKEIIEIVEDNKETKMNCSFCKFEGFLPDYKKHAAKCLNHYKCSKCDGKFDSIGNYAAHFTEHGYAINECPHCEVVLKNITMLTVHIQKHVRNCFTKVSQNKEDVYSCSCCQVAVCVEFLFDHWEAHLTNNTLDPDDDRVLQEFVLTDKLVKKAIEIIVQKNIRYKNVKLVNITCFVCNMRFESHRLMKRHVIEHMLSHALRVAQGSQTLQCQMCQKHLDVNNYSLHMMAHANLRPYICKTCKKYFDNHDQLVRHKAVHMDTCGFCLEKTQCQKFFRNDKRKGRVYVCDVCLKSNEVKSSISRYSIRCKVCSEVCRTSQVKFDHEWEKHGLRDIAADCPICFKQFRRLTDVKHHMTDIHAVHTTPEDSAMLRLFFESRTKQKVQKPDHVSAVPYYP